MTKVTDMINKLMLIFDSENIDKTSKTLEKYITGH